MANAQMLIAFWFNIINGRASCHSKGYAASSPSNIYFITLTFDWLIDSLNHSNVSNQAALVYFSSISSMAEPRFILDVRGTPSQSNQYKYLLPNIFNWLAGNFDPLNQLFQSIVSQVSAPARSVPMQCDQNWPCLETEMAI